MIEALESRCLLSATVEVTAKGAAAYEGGPSRFFYIRRSGDTSQPQSVFYIVGGKAKQTLDYHPIGTGITIQPGRWLRRIEIVPLDDSLQENNEAITLTIIPHASYAIDPNKTAATIRII